MQVGAFANRWTSDESDQTTGCVYEHLNDKLHRVFDVSVLNRDAQSQIPAPGGQHHQQHEQRRNRRLSVGAIATTVTGSDNASATEKSTIFCGDGSQGRAWEHRLW
jgi:hypothetical protein